MATRRGRNCSMSARGCLPLLMLVASLLVFCSIKFGSRAGGLHSIHTLSDLAKDALPDAEREWLKPRDPHQPIRDILTRRPTNSDSVVQGNTESFSAQGRLVTHVKEPSGEQLRWHSMSETNLSQALVSLVEQQTYNDDRMTDDGKVKVILLTYMRSGSTFTAEVFNQHPEVFYFYEPLRTLDFHFKRNEPAFFFGREQLQYNASDPLQLETLQQHVVSGCLHCRFMSLPLQPLRVGWARNKSRSCRPFADCSVDNPGLQGLVTCLPLLNDACREAKVVVVKTTRFTMMQVATLLKDDPNVKVIHLLRDPRGVLRSREAVKFIPSPLVMQLREIQSMCRTILQDVKDSYVLKQQYPGRILTARYEDLANKPQEMAQRLLRFAGLHMDRKLRHYLWSITSSEGDFEEVTWQTKRRNSRRTAVGWRFNMTFDTVAVVDRACESLYSHLGYVSLPMKTMLRDMRIGTLRPFNKLPTLWTY